MLTKIEEIIQQYFNSDYSDKVRKEFALWLKSMGQEKEAALKELWEKHDAQADQTTEESYMRLISRIKASTPVVTAKQKKVSFIRKFTRIAAIFTLPLISAGITYFVIKSPVIGSDSVNLVECIVPEGEIRTITLPDSSIVTINSGSILVYPRQFTGNRDIYLNGEAYFNVAKNEEKPFTVKTTDMDVEVLGTVFNISSYTDDQSSSAALESGKVNVLLKNSGSEPVILHPNEQLTYNRISGKAEKKTVNIKNTIAWTSGNLVIHSLQMDEIIRLIERKYAMNVFLNSSNYGNERITMKLTNNEDIDEFMQILQYLVPHLKYRIEEDKLFIY